MSNAHTALTYSAPTPLQKGVAEALKAEDGSFDGVPFTFHRNAEMLAAALTARGLDVFPPEGGYFLCANCHEPAMGFAFVENSLTRPALSIRLPLAFYETPPAEDSRVTICKTHVAARGGHVGALLRHARRICKRAAHVERACEASDRRRTRGPTCAWTGSSPMGAGHLHQAS